MARGRLLVLLPAVLQQLAPGAAFQMGDNRYDHEWIAKASMPIARSDMTATTVGNAIYLIGGCSGDQEWNAGANMYLCAGVSDKTVKYMPASDTYETLDDAPRSRYRHGAAAVGTSVYLFGGVDLMDNVIPQVDVLDTTAGTWSTLPDDKNMPNATTDLMAVAVDDEVYVIGGYILPDYIASNAMQIFNPAADSPWRSGPSMMQARGDAFAGYADGKVYAVGGFTHDNGFEQPLDHVEMLDPSLLNGGWTEKRRMSVRRGDKAVASLHGVLHVIGGETKNGQEQSVPLTDVEAYDAGNDVWYQGGAIQSHRFRFNAAAHGDSIYIFGGQGYLQGNHSEVGSKYPVLDTVEAYKETVSLVTLGAPGPKGSLAAVLLAAASALAWPLLGA